MPDSIDVLKFVAPEFADLDEDVLEMALSLAAQRVSARAFRGVYQQAASYMAAHILATSRGAVADAGIGGTITSVRTGDLAVGAAALPTGTAADGALASTTYGARFLELRASIATSPFTGR